MFLPKRIQFFLGHLTISSLLALSSLALVFTVWYPAPLHTAMGVTHIFLLMLAIDVVLGPLLTLIVYKEGKKTLKFDLATIAVLQIAALLYGLYTVSSGRPVWLVYDIDRFEVVSPVDIDPKHSKNAAPAYKTAGWLQPQYVALRPAKNAEEKQKRLFDELNGVVFTARPDLYQPIDTAKQLIQKKAKPLALLSTFNPKPQVADILQQYPQADAFVPLKAAQQDMTVLINRKQARVVAIVDLRPWKL